MRSYLKRLVASSRTLFHRSPVVRQQSGDDKVVRKPGLIRRPPRTDPRYGDQSIPPGSDDLPSGRSGRRGTTAGGTSRWWKQ